MSEKQKEMIDFLVAHSHWDALGTLCRMYGGEIFDYIHSQEDCPW